MLMAKKEKQKSTLFKKLFKLSLILTSLFFVYILIVFFQVYYAARNDDVNEDTKVDAIVVLGAAQYNGRPSNVLKARLDHALDLYERGVAPTIIVTGGNQPGDQFTEATASAKYLMDRGVKDGNILREVHGNSTYDSLRDTAAFTKDRDIEKVVIVTDGFHELRAQKIASEVGLNAIGSPTPNSPISGTTEWKYFVSETGRVSLGNVIGFRRVSKDSTLVNRLQS